MGLDGAAGDCFIAMCKAGVWLNVILLVFNLLPLPPSMAAAFLTGLLPYQYASMLGRIRPYGFFIVIFLLVTQGLGEFLVAAYWWLDHALDRPAAHAHQTATGFAMKVALAAAAKRCLPHSLKTAKTGRLTGRFLCVFGVLGRQSCPSSY